MPELGFKISASLPLSRYLDKGNDAENLKPRYLDKGNDAENLKPSSGVFFTFRYCLTKSTKLSWDQEVCFFLKNRNKDFFHQNVTVCPAWPDLV